MIASLLISVLPFLPLLSLATPITNLTVTESGATSQSYDVPSGIVCHGDSAIYPPVDEVICENVIAQLSKVNQHGEKLYRQHDPPVMYPLKEHGLCFSALSGTVKHSAIIFTYSEWVKAVKAVLDTCHGNMGGRNYVRQVSKVPDDHAEFLLIEKRGFSFPCQVYRGICNRRPHP